MTPESLDQIQTFNNISRNEFPIQTLVFETGVQTGAPIMNQHKDKPNYEPYFWTDKVEFIEDETQVGIVNEFQGLENVEYVLLNLIQMAIKLKSLGMK